MIYLFLSNYCCHLVWNIGIVFLSCHHLCFLIYFIFKDIILIAPVTYLKIKIYGTKNANIWNKGAFSVLLYIRQTMMCVIKVNKQRIKAIQYNHSFSSSVFSSKISSTLPSSHLSADWWIEGRNDDCFQRYKEGDPLNLSVSTLEEEYGYHKWVRVLMLNIVEYSSCSDLCSWMIFQGNKRIYKTK